METIIKVALMSAFFILNAGKSGVRDGLISICDKLKLKLLSKMFDCDFCLSFWMNVGITAIFICYMPDRLLELACIPFIATPLTRFLL